MRPEGVIALVLAHAALGAGVLALLAVVQIGAPALAERAAGQASARPGRSLLVGAGLALAWLGLASLAEQAGARAVGALVGLGGVALLVLAVLGAAHAVGERIASELGWAPLPLARLALGWWTLAFLVYVPVLGWCALAAALLMGLGAGARALLGGEVEPAA